MIDEVPSKDHTRERRHADVWIDTCDGRRFRHHPGHILPCPSDGVRSELRRIAGSPRLIAFDPRIRPVTADGRSGQSVPEMPSLWRLRAASLVMLGRHEDASAAVDEISERFPADSAWYQANLTRFGSDEARERYRSALRSAGLPI